jgi:hypothetical protein
MNVTSFATIEEMVAYMDKNNREADDRILPWQREFKAGDCFLRVTDDGWGEPLVIFGEIYESPYAEDREHLAEPHMANKRLAKCYSVMCEDGESGSIHISTMHLKLTKEEFEEARARGWKPDMQEMLRAYETQYPITP